jgi:hypothetical protein
LNIQKKLLATLLLRKSSRSRLWLAWISLCAGTTLLLLSVMIWWNFQELLYGSRQQDSLGSTFLTISKQVTSANMGRPDLTVFSQPEISALRHAPQVRDVGVLTSNKFPAFIRLTANMDFSSEIFLEAVPDQFIDKKPQDWNWQEGSREVPIILSGEFLSLYNYGFALSQGLPQLSQASIQALSFDLVLGPPELRETYTARVVGFSDRITSVLVPQAFIVYANGRYAPSATAFPSRLILNVADPSDKGFVRMLEQKGYVTNGEHLRWNKLRSVVEVVAASTGVLAALLMGISVLVFILFIELTIARAQQSLQLLLQLGYEPGFLRRFMLGRFMPLLFSAIVVALSLAALAQYLAARFIESMNLQLPVFPGWPVWTAASISTLLLLLQVRYSVRRAMQMSL